MNIILMERLIKKYLHKLVKIDKLLKILQLICIKV